MTQEEDHTHLDLGGEIQLCELSDSGSKLYTLNSTLYPIAFPPHATRVFIAKGEDGGILRSVFNISGAQASKLGTSRPILNNEEEK